MSKKDADHLLNLGADFVGGVAYLDRKEVGRWNNGEFYPEPGTEDIVAAHTKRKRDEEAAIAENARLLAESQKPAKAAAPAKTVKVTEKPADISATEAATTMNSVPGTGPQNPVRVDAQNNASPASEPVDAETFLNTLGNPEAADAVKAGKKEAAGTGTEDPVTLGAGKNAAKGQ